MIPTHEFCVPKDWCDYNEHFSDCYYLIPFSVGLDHVLDWAGLGARYRGDYSTYTVESGIRYLHEAKEGDRLTVTSAIADCDAKRLFTKHAMKRGGQLIATCHFVCLHVDVRIPKAAPFPLEIANRLVQGKSPRQNEPV